MAEDPPPPTGEFKRPFRLIGRPLASPRPAPPSSPASPPQSVVRPVTPPQLRSPAEQMRSDTEAPLKLFHGSPEDFTEFSPGKLGSIDLATDPAFAQRYSRARRPGQKEGAGNLYQVNVNAKPGEFLNIDNPEAGQRWDALVQEKGAVEASRQLQKEGYAGVSREHGVYSLFDETRAQITHKNGEEIGANAPAAPAAKAPLSAPRSWP